MSTRLDLVIQKFPEHESAVRALAARDPSGNLKYLDWGVKMVASGQALAPEVADVLDLFHQFAGQRVGGGGRHRRRHTHAQAAKDWVRPDIYTYRPQDLAGLRDLLLKAKRARDRKRRERERLYRIEGSVEAAVVYDSPDLVVRHIKNKQASVHYGLSTKWCISMLREEYFEDYESRNATFFFFERKVRADDEFDKVAVMLPRSREGVAEAFTALDRRVDMMGLAGVYGPRVFDIFRAVYEQSEQYPGSAIFCVYAGTATCEQVEAVFAAVKEGLHLYRASEVLEAICCNDAAPWSVLEEILGNAAALFASAPKSSRRRIVRRSRWRLETVRRLECAIESAIFIHPNTPADVREAVAKKLRRRHIKLDVIHRVTDDGEQIRVAYRSGETHVYGRRVHYRRHRRRPNTPKELRKRAAMYDRVAVRYRKRAKQLQRKLAEAKARAKMKARAKRRNGR